MDENKIVAMPTIPTADVVDEATEESSEAYFRDLATKIPGMDGLEALASFLSMPDDAFEAMKPIMLEEMERGFNNSNAKYDMALALNMSGMSVAELNKVFEDSIAKIDEQFKDYDQSRRDFVKQVLTLAVNGLQSAKASSNKIIRIPIELTSPDAHIPTYAHDGDAGCDVYALDDYTVEPHQTMMIPLGFRVAIPKGYELQMRPRSGMSLKTKIRVANAPGTIDSNYRGEVGLIIDLDGGILVNIFMDDVRLDKLCRQVLLGIAEIGGVVGLHITMGAFLDRLQAQLILEHAIGGEKVVVGGSLRTVEMGVIEHQVLILWQVIPFEDDWHKQRVDNDRVAEGHACVEQGGCIAYPMCPIEHLIGEFQLIFL